MLMICWIYCAPFLEWLFYALSPIIFIFSLLMLKRGVRQRRSALRTAAFIVMFAAVCKLFTVDAYILKDSLLCGTNYLYFACNKVGFGVFGLLSLAAFGAASYGVFILYKRFRHDKLFHFKTEEHLRLRTWANAGMGMVLLLMLWLVVPWFKYLVSGNPPELLVGSSWKYFSFLTLAVLLSGFWHYEDCETVTQNIKRKKSVGRAWSPRDTMWLSVLFFALAEAFLYISYDFLSGSAF